MHVCMVLPEPYPPDIRVTKEADALLDAGHEVTLLCRGTDDRPARERVDGIDVVRLDESAPRARVARAGSAATNLLTGVHPRWGLVLRRLLDERAVDAVHAHDLPLVRTALVATRGREVPVVADLHENFPEAIRQWRRPHLDGDGSGALSVRIDDAFMPVSRWKRIERSVLPKVDRVLTVCEEAASHYHRDCRVLPTRTRIVGNTVDLDEFGAAEAITAAGGGGVATERAILADGSAAADSNGSAAADSNGPAAVGGNGTAPGGSGGVAGDDGAIGDDGATAADSGPADAGPDGNPVAEHVDGEAFVVTYVGGFGPHRGLETAIEGIAAATGPAGSTDGSAATDPGASATGPDAPDPHLLLVGSGADRHRESLERLIADLGVGDRVTFTGWVDFERVPGYMAGSDVCLVPHASTPHTETTVPHKLFQYMAVGAPVIVTDVAPLERIVAETDAGLVVPADDGPAMGGAISALASDPEEAERLGENGRDAVRERYNWRVDAERLVETYEELVGE